MLNLSAFKNMRVVLEVPVGLDVACINMARREYGVKMERLTDGYLISKKKEAVDVLLTLLNDAPIWTFGSFMLAAQSSKKEAADADAIAEAIRNRVEQQDIVGQAFWLKTPKEASRPLQKLKSTLLKECDLAIVNNPTDYALTLSLHEDDKNRFVFLGKAISVKARFDYRLGDVGASINPVLAACLARLMPDTLDGLALDPTSGSGTLLYERLRYSAEKRGLALDISDKAQTVAKANGQALSFFDGELTYKLGSGAQPELWEPCTTVLCNLPFGIRIKEDPKELERLYSQILNNALSNLADEGRILMTSSFKRGLEVALEQAGDKVKLLSRYRVEMGGLFYQVFVMKKAG